MTITASGENEWNVLSDSGRTYVVWDAGCEDAEHGGGMHCDCPAGKHGRTCKHVRAVLEFAMAQAAARNT